MGKIKSWMLDMEDSLDDYLDNNPTEHSLDGALVFIKEKISYVDRNYVSKLYHHRTKKLTT